MRVVKTFTVGSNAFFADMEGYSVHDVDELCFVDEYPFQPSIMRFTIGEKDLLVCKDMTKAEFMQYSLEHDGLTVGKFLVPEFAEHIGMTIEDLKSLQSVIDRLDDKHSYEKVIYDAYLENNGFFLTESQRAKAYEMYKLKRL